MDTSTPRSAPLPRRALPDARLRLRPLIIAVLLLMVGALPLVVATHQAALILFLVAGSGLVLVCLLRPPYGLIAAALSGVFVPAVGPSGLNVTVILVGLALGLWILQVASSHGQPRHAPSRPVWPLLAFVGIACVSLGVGVLPWFVFAVHAPLWAQWGGLSIVVLSAGTFLLAAYQLHDGRWLSRTTWAFLAAAAISVVARSLLPQLGFHTQNWFPPMGSVFLTCLVAMAFSQAVFNDRLRPGWRLALGALVLATLYVQLFQKFADKSGWIPPLVALATIIGLRSRRAALALVPVAALSVWILAPSVLDTDVYSVSTRFEAWSIMAQIIKFSPIWGLGFANYYWYTPLFPIRGYSISFNSHNNYVDITAQTGLIGLACFVWFLWEVGRLGLYLRTRAPEGFARAYAYGALGALAGMIVAAMLGDWVLPFFYNIGLNGFRSSMLGWLFLGGLVSLEQIERLGGEGK